MASRLLRVTGAQPIAASFMQDSEIDRLRKRSVGHRRSKMMTLDYGPRSVRCGRVLALPGKLVILVSTRNASFMAQRYRSTFLVVCLALFTGCLEFEQQTLTYRYDAKTDTLRIFQSYQGIFGADAKDGLSQDELAQLDSVLTGQRTFFFANWIFELESERFWLEFKVPTSVFL